MPTQVEMLAASPLAQSQGKRRQKHGQPFPSPASRHGKDGLGGGVHSLSLPSLDTGKPAVLADLMPNKGKPGSQRSLRHTPTGRNVMSTRNHALGDPQVERILPRLQPHVPCGAQNVSPKPLHKGAISERSRSGVVPESPASSGLQEKEALSPQKTINPKAVSTQPQKREQAPPVDEVHCLSEITSAATNVCKELESVMQFCDSLADRSVFEFDTLREISNATQRVQEELLDDDDAGAEVAAIPELKEYDDPILAKARKITALTNKLCDELSHTTETFGNSTKDAIESEALREISLVTRKVVENMRALQGESWAEGVLRVQTSYAEAFGEQGQTDLPNMLVSDSQNGGMEGELGGHGRGLNSTGRLGSRANRQNNTGSAQAVVATVSMGIKKIEGVPGIEELLAHSALHDMDRAPGQLFTEQDIARMQVAFKRFKIPDSSDLHLSDVPSLLKYLGHVMTKQEALEPFLREITTYEYLDFDEFIAFMERYIPYERQQVRIVFDRYDEDHSGGISVTELKPLLLELGFIPLHAMIAEALELVDKNHNADLDFEEFVVFLAVYRRAEGFTHPECLELRRIFDFFSREGDNPKELLPAECLSDALVQMFGLHVSEFTESLEEQLRNGNGLQRSGGGKTDSLTFGEFLIFARKTREEALSKLRSEHGGEDNEFTKGDENGDGVINETELRAYLRKKGYTPLQQNLDEVYSEVDRDANSLLDFNEFFDFMLIFQQREGFLKAVVEEMRLLFDRFDSEGSGEISAVELAELFRQLGYRLSWDELHIYVAQVDENNSGKLDFREYLRLMRLFREEELENMSNIFDEHSVNDLLPRKKVSQALHAVEQDVPKALVTELVGDLENLDFDKFVGLVDDCRQDRVRRERKKAGFTDERIAELQELFERFDKDKGGEIDTLELLGILKVFGWEPKTREEQQVLMKKLDTARARAREAGIKDTGADGSATIEFWTFVQLSRMLETEHQHLEEERMQALMQKLSFSQKEVEGFREIFLAKKKEWSEEQVVDGKPPPVAPGLPQDAVKRLIKALGVAIIGEKKPQLDNELRKLGCVGEGYLDFFGFLELMRWLMESNWLPSP